MSCEHSTRLEYCGAAWCFDCERWITQRPEAARPFPVVAPTGSFWEFLAQATFEHN